MGVWAGLMFARSYELTGMIDHGTALALWCMNYRHVYSDVLSKLCLETRRRKTSALLDLGKDQPGKLGFIAAHED